MDATTEFVAKKLPNLHTKLDYFVVAGASKRGWTTWLAIFYYDNINIISVI